MPNKIRNPFSFPDLDLDPGLRQFFTLMDEVRLTIGLIAGMGSNVLRIAKVNSSGQLSTGDTTAAAKLDELKALLTDTDSAAELLTSIVEGIAALDAKLVSSETPAAAWLAGIASAIDSLAAGPASDTASATGTLAAALSDITGPLATIAAVLSDVHVAGTHSIKTST